MAPSPLLLPLILAAGLSAPQESPRQGPEPEARRLLRELTARPRLAGTSGGRRGARWVAQVLQEAGWAVERDEREVLLSYPRRIEVALQVGSGERFRRVEVFDPRALPPGDVPPFNAWSASGEVTAEVVDVGLGLARNYARLAADGVEVEGRIALARYGGAYRGVKAEAAEAAGCRGLLLYSDPEEDGAGRGDVWPGGRWKPGTEAERGSILPLARVPGDPSTPGWPSGAPGAETRRVTGPELEARLPRIPVTPLGADEARAILAAGADARVTLAVEAPRELFTVVNVLARLRGLSDDFVLAGNHRDAWVRGAHDAGSGTVALLLAARRLSALVADGWEPPCDLVLAFWDAEEPGLIGSTEWAEAHGGLLREHGLVYVNADAVVSGLSFDAAASPGLLAPLRSALLAVPAPPESGVPTGPGNYADLWEQWTEHGTRVPRPSLPGSGSDYTAFLHHLGLPVIDVTFRGNAGGHYHTRFDDFAMVDRYLDPTWEGHALAGHFLAELLFQLSERGRSSLDARAAAVTLGLLAREAGQEFLGTEPSERLALAFDGLADALEGAPRTGDFYRRLALEEGLPGRPWYRNPWWAPGLDTGYSAETFPTLRHAAAQGPGALEQELGRLLQLIQGWTRRLQPADAGTGADLR